VDAGAGVPTGTVEFFDGSTDLGPGSALSGSGSSATSTFSSSTLAVGSHNIIAVFTGSGGYQNNDNKAFPRFQQVAAVATPGSGDSEVFVIGLDGQVYAQHIDPQGHSQGGYRLVAPGQVKALSAGKDGLGHIELFVVGLDNQVYRVSFDAA